MLRASSLRVLTVVATTFLVTAPVSSQDPDYVLRAPDLTGLSGANLDASIVLDNIGSALEGWSFDLCHTDEVSADEILAGSALDGLDFEFEAITVEVDAVAIVATPAVGTTLDIGSDLELYVVRYSLLSEGTADLTFCGDYEDAELTIDGGTIDPTTVDGSIEVVEVDFTESFLFWAPNVEFVFDPAVATGEIRLPVAIAENETNATFPTETMGFSFGLYVDPDYLNPTDVVSVQSLAALNTGTGPEILVTEILDDGITVFALYGLISTGMLVFDGNPIMECVFELESDELLNATAPVSTEATFTVPPMSTVDLVVIDTATTFFGEGSDAAITFVPDGERLFKRGDVDGNGDVSPLLDALALLQFTFAGGVPPICADATDVDNNGILSSLVDSLALLGWAFGSLDVPPDPGVETCGPDPEGDADGIECETAPAC